MSEYIINNLKCKKSPLYPNYAASQCGKIFRISTKKAMSVSPQGHPPYLYFRACHNNKASNVRVHRAVASAWIDNPENHSDVNHKDGNKFNNHISNLEWVSKAQNQAHAHSTGLKGIGEKLYNASMEDSIAHLVCQRLQDGWTIKSISDVLSISKDVVRKIKAGDTYFHIRVLYNIDHTYPRDFSESTVRWVCERILKGLSDLQIAKESTNSNLKKIDVKRIRHKIRYKIISDEYF